MKPNHEGESESAPALQTKDSKEHPKVSEAALHKELDLIQGVITRMAQNSFQVKTWFLGGISAMAAFGNGDLVSTAAGGNWVALVLTVFLLLIIFTFWYLDSYFLSMERHYREIYRWVTQNRHKTTDYLYDLGTFKRKDEQGEEQNLMKPSNGIRKVMFSITIKVMYGPIMMFALGLLLYNFGMLLYTSCCL